MQGDRLSIESWLTDVRSYVNEKAHHILPILDIYIGEARFGRQYISRDLSKLPKGASVLEVGAGSMLLSCQLVREGFQVTALEPIGDGFSHFKQIQELVLNRAEALGYMPKILNLSIEELSSQCCFNYAFSINTMEHVGDVALTIANVGNSLKFGAIYRFTCPNYLFPYEPHLNIPTLFSKRLTEKLFLKTIHNNIKPSNSVGLWNSLNWITAAKINRIIKHLPELTIAFNRRFLVKTFERITFDKDFAMRRSKLIYIIISALVKLRLHYLVVLIPAMLQPTIDCTITRVRVPGVS